LPIARAHDQRNESQQLLASPFEQSGQFLPQDEVRCQSVSGDQNDGNDRLVYRLENAALPLVARADVGVNPNFELVPLFGQAPL